MPSSTFQVTIGVKRGAFESSQALLPPRFVWSTRRSLPERAPFSIQAIQPKCAAISSGVITLPWLTTSSLTTRAGMAITPQYAICIMSVICTTPRSQVAHGDCLPGVGFQLLAFLATGPQNLDSQCLLHGLCPSIS
jgi:hypothetical protein